MSQALYYPWIDVSDEAWLKTALLYWDSVRTIVPESINAPYSTDTGRTLQDAGFLVPLRVHSGMDEIEDLAADVLTYLQSAEVRAPYAGWCGRGGPRGFSLSRLAASRITGTQEFAGDYHGYS